MNGINTDDWPQVWANLSTDNRALVTRLTRAVTDFLTDLRTLAADYLAVFDAAEQPTTVGDPFPGYTTVNGGIEDRDDPFGDERDDFPIGEYPPYP